MSFEYQGFATLGVNLNRQKYGPLDISNVFTSIADLNYYITKGAVTEGVSTYWYKSAEDKVVPYPYAGQVIALVQMVDVLGEDGQPTFDEEGAKIQKQEVQILKLTEKADGTFETSEIGSKVDLSAYAKTEDVEKAIEEAIAAIPDVVYPDIVANDDDVVVVEADGHTLTASHAKKGPASGAAKGATADAELKAFGGSIEFKVPHVTVDEYGHTTAVDEKTIKVSVPALPEDQNTQYELKYETITVGEGEEATEKKVIRLYSDDGEVVSTIDASEFVKDGMLDDVAYDASTNTLTFTWNTAAGTKTDTVTLSDIIDPYVAGDLIEIDGTTISHSTVSAPSVEEDNSGERTYVTGISVDGYGHIVGYTTAQETVEDTNDNDTYIAGNGIEISDSDKSNTEHTVSVKIASGEQNLKLDVNGLSTTFDLADYASDERMDNAEKAIEDLDKALDDEIDRATKAEAANATAAANAQSAAETADAKAVAAQTDVDALELVVDEKVDKQYELIPVIDERSGSEISAEQFAEGTFYVLEDGEYTVATEYVENTTYYTQAVDSEGALLFDKVAYTLLSPEEKEKLEKLVFDEDGGVSVSGNINISQVQGLNGYLKEEHLSQPVVEKLNFITSVDSANFTVTNNKLMFTPTTGRLLTSDDETKINFIRNVDVATFEIADVKTGTYDDNGAEIIVPRVLQLKSVPATALTSALGDLSAVPTVTLKNGTTSNTIVDNIANIYEILTWGDMT